MRNLEFRIFESQGEWDNSDLAQDLMCGGLQAAGAGCKPAPRDSRSTVPAAQRPAARDAPRDTAPG
jgi:hypothetical protein